MPQRPHGSHACSHKLAVCAIYNQLASRLASRFFVVRCRHARIEITPGGRRQAAATHRRRVATTRARMLFTHAQSVERGGWAVVHHRNRSQQSAGWGCGCVSRFMRVCVRAHTRVCARARVCMPRVTCFTVACKRGTVPLRLVLLWARLTDPQRARSRTDPTRDLAFCDRRSMGTSVACLEGPRRTSPTYYGQ
jgi:hypothetical protein